jgi:hypothetical protein
MPPAIARIRVFFEQKKPLLRQPPVLVGLCGLLLLIILVSVVAIRSSRGPAANVNAVITPNAGPTEAQAPQQATPTPDVEPSPQPGGSKTQNPSPRRDPADRPAGTSREKKNEKGFLKKTGDTFKKGANKIRKIFKNPF